MPELRRHRYYEASVGIPELLLIARYAAFALSRVLRAMIETEGERDG